jgi:tetratricopeptide (TPR) repeat protein
VVSAGDPYDQTAEVDLADVRQAVEKSGALPAVRDKILQAHKDLRAALAKPQVAPDLAAPRGLPPELYDYLEGAVAWHQGRLDKARAAWERLLARPAAERPLRSTWAAFMLGKAAMKSRPDDAVRWFVRTRELAAQGFSDPLGLAFDSLGWQARTEMNRGRYDLALPLYLQQSRGGAEVSLRMACEEALHGSHEALVRAARSPQSRALLTAWVLTPGEDRRGILWQRALRAAGLRNVPDADRLAWVAYQEADFAAAQQWVERAPQDAPMARWIRAKLLLRRGRLEEARRLFHDAGAALPPAAMTEDEAWMYAWDTSYSVQLATGPQAEGEEAVVLLSQGRYPEALDGFLRNGFWLDAAWVAERVMTTDELRAEVDAHWPADLAARFKPGETDLFAGGLIHPRREWVAWSIRCLLGRRLVRDGRLDEARAYLPADLKPAVDALEEGLRAESDAARPVAERAAALFRAACAARRQGMELLGTEIDPDWFALERGQYELPELIAGLANRGRHHLPPPARDEQERAARHKTAPWKRFHYRYRAADLARRAAALLPDGSEDKARILASGGWWLALRDPKAAAPFYRELVRCCGDTALGRQASRRNWLPPVEACDAGHDAVKAGDSAEKGPHPRPLSHLPPPIPGRGEKSKTRILPPQRLASSCLPSPGGGVGGAGRGAGGEGLRRPASVR